MEPLDLSWAPPAIAPIPLKLVSLTSFLSLLRVARAASGTRKSPSFDGFGHLVSRGKLHFPFMDSLNSPGRARFENIARSQGSETQSPLTIRRAWAAPVTLSHQFVNLRQ